MHILMNSFDTLSFQSLINPDCLWEHVRHLQSKMCFRKICLYHFLNSINHDSCKQKTNSTNNVILRVCEVLCLNHEYCTDMCLFSRHCLDICPHSSYCADIFCWFLAVSLINYPVMCGLIYQPRNRQNNLSHIFQQRREG